MFRLSAIRAGQAEWKGGYYVVNGRTYGVEQGGRLYPVAGPGLHQLDRSAYKVLQYLNTYGDSDTTRLRIRKEGLSGEQVKTAYELWRAGR